MDDYGICIDFSITENLKDIAVKIDILKATGNIYEEKQFFMIDANNELSNCFDYIKSIPEFMTPIFMKDYNIS